MHQHFYRRFQRCVGIHSLINQHPQHHARFVDRLLTQGKQAIRLWPINQLLKQCKCAVKLRLALRIDLHLFRCHANLTPFKGINDPAQILCQTSVLLAK